MREVRSAQTAAVHADGVVELAGPLLVRGGLLIDDGAHEHPRETPDDRADDGPRRPCGRSHDGAHEHARSPPFGLVMAPPSTPGFHGLGLLLALHASLD